MSDSRPNIILIMPDQQRGDALGCEDHPVLLTPNIDAMAGAGTRFSRCYSTCPSCIPARRALLSGQYPSTNGMVGFGGDPNWEPLHTLPGELSKAGYQTHLVGRTMHQAPEYKRYGYDHMNLGSGYEQGDNYDLEFRRESGQHDGFGGHGLPFNGWNAKPWHLNENLHPTNWVVNEALRFIQTRDPSCPFFLTISFYAPHPPLCPPAFYMDRYLRQDMPEPAIGDWATPPPNDGKNVRVESPRVKLQGEQLRSAQAGYYGLINHIDNQIYRILGSRHGSSYPKSNTVIMYTSDHGEMLGDHYMYRKCEPYEGSARVPLVISGGSDLGFKPGQVFDKPACLEDIMPTCMDLAGCDIPDTLDGRSLVPILRGETDTQWRDVLHGEHSPCYSEEQANHYLTDGKMKYIWRPTSGSEQLFDLQNDPNECHDLTADADQAELVTTWRNRLIEQLKDRPEEFTDGSQLIAGRPYPRMMQSN